MSRRECTQVYPRFPEPDLQIVEELHPGIRPLPTGRQSRRQIANMGFELVPVWVEEVEGCAFTAVVAPFLHVGGSQPFDEEREVYCVNAKGEMSVIGGGFGVAQWIEGRHNHRPGSER